MIYNQRVKWWQTLKIVVSIVVGTLVSLVIIGKFEIDSPLDSLLWVNAGLVGISFVLMRMLWNQNNSLSVIYESLTRREVKDLNDVSLYLTKKIKVSFGLCLVLAMYFKFGNFILEDESLYFISLGGIAGLMVLNNMQFLDNYLELTAFKSKKQIDMAELKKKEATLKRMKD